MARLVVVVKEQSQAGLVHLVTLAERERLSRKASQSLPQRVVELLDVYRGDTSLPHVTGEEGAKTTRLLDIATPEDAAGCLASVADGESDDLTSSAA